MSAAGSRVSGRDCSSSARRGRGPLTRVARRRSRRRAARDERVTSGAHACMYPEGKCSCVRSTPCSGVPRPPGEPRWRCQAARRDGCPNDAPPQGGACAAPGKTCSYGNCGSIAYTCDAQKRAWFISGVTAPPPSMAGGGGVHALPHPPGPPPLPPHPPSTPPRPRRRRRGKPVLPARPSVARRAARARRRRAAKRCHRCAAASALPGVSSRAHRVRSGRQVARRLAQGSIELRLRGDSQRRPGKRNVTPCDPERHFQPVACVLVSIAIGCGGCGGRRTRSAQAATTISPSPGEVVSFPSGNLTLSGLIYKPSGPGPFPAVLADHGSAPGMLNNQAFDAIGPRFAARGWVFFAPYRRGQGLSASAGPYVMDAIEAATKKGGVAAGSAAMVSLLQTDHLADQLAALSWLRKASFVRVDQIAAAGNSFGGIETVLGVEREAYCARHRRLGSCRELGKIARAPDRDGACRSQCARAASSSR